VSNILQTPEDQNCFYPGDSKAPTPQINNIETIQGFGISANMEKTRDKGTQKSLAKGRKTRSGGKKRPKSKSRSNSKSKSKSKSKSRSKSFERSKDRKRRSPKL